MSVVVVTEHDSSVVINSETTILIVSDVGVQGLPGQGVPVGGTTGQILSKIDGTNYNTEWRDEAGTNPSWGGILGTLSDQTDLQSELDAIQSDINTHELDTSNPHSVTKTQVGLNNVDNTSDLNKPISTAMQTALDGKENIISPATVSDYYRGDKTFQPLNKSAVGLNNVDNTSDLNKPISTATQTALDGKENIANKNTANGYVGFVSNRLQLRNDAGTFNPVIQSLATSNHITTIPNRTGILLDDTDLAFINADIAFVQATADSKTTQAQVRTIAFMRC